MSKSVVTKRHYLVVTKSKEVVKVTLDYAEALSMSVMIPGGWVLEVMAKRVLEALKSASREHRCAPCVELVRELKIKWEFGESIQKR